MSQGARRTTSSLLRKLSLSLLGLLLGLSTAQVLLVLWMFNRVADESEQRLMLSTASELAQIVAPFLEEPPRYHELQQAAAAFRAANPRLSLYVADEHGRIVGQFSYADSRGVAEHIDLAPIRRLIAEGAQAPLPLYAADPAETGRKVIFSAAELPVLGRPGYLFVTLNNELASNVYSMSAENVGVTTTVLAFAASVLIAAVLGYRLISYLNRRLQGLADAVQRFSRNDFSTRIEVDTRDEIGALAANINTMADTIEHNIGQLEERDALRRALIADVSHDLRGPVAGIKGYLGVLELMDAETLVARFGSILPGIAKSTDSLERLLAELFELAKFEAKEQQPERMLFELTGLCEEAAARCRGLAESKGLGLELQLPEVDVHVRGDPGMLERAIANLLENGIYYSPEQGSLTLSLAVNGGSATVAVSDTGIGIAPEDVNRIFGRFQQGANSKNSTRASSGLGLAIVQRILELHDSKIEVTSEPGRGSTFSFRLPLGSSQNN